MRGIKNWMLSLVLMGSAVAGHAQEAQRPFYVGATGGHAVIDSPQPTSLVEGSTEAFNLKFGYRMNRHLSFELSHLNFADDDTTTNGAPRTHLKQYGTGGSVAVGMPVTATWRVDLRGGMYYMTAEFANYSSSQVPVGSSTVKSWEPFWGLSSEWALGSSPVTLQFEYLRVKVKYGFPIEGSGSSRVFAFGANYRF